MNSKNGSMSFNKILIANRGEIAVRIIRACREMDIHSVAVYSDADRDALHTQIADEAIHIGASPAVESYLNSDRIIEAAKLCGAEAIHPGYGFLSENWQFNKACTENGIIFIGPSWESTKLLGDKITSREAMISAGIPVVPGFNISELPDKEIDAKSMEAGFPILVKASAGGGGKGMRVVTNPDDLREAIQSAKREAAAAFGDDTIFIEKYLESPRHIEFQILGDKEGNIIHLFERECSIQRRHQKIVEESPSTALSDELRQKMGETAVQVARSAGYYNAGTVEFLLDSEDNYYFLEVNTRIQVEHPVTEMVTGIDLVQEQIRIASGGTVSHKQSDISQNGHAIEVRIYAEDPEQNFLPSAGKILFQKEPAGPGIRVDSGIFSGCEVSVHYDPILAKLIVHAEDRPKAIARMSAALNDYPVLGIKTTGGFLKSVMQNERYKRGEISTKFLDNEAEYFQKWINSITDFDILNAAAAADTAWTVKKTAPIRQSKIDSTWEQAGAWQIGTRRSGGSNV